MSEPLANLRDPVVLCAFEGWSDASDAASSVLVHLGMIYDADVLFEIDPQDFYDFQVNRPRTRLADTGREVEWQTTTISVVHTPERDLVLVEGPEPNFHWRRFVEALVSAFRTIDPQLVIVLGAMLTDAPHTRPTPVFASSDGATLRERFGLEMSTYEGPTGITGVLTEACHRVGMPTVSLWASLPHYVSSPPNPKATLALLERLEELLDQTLDTGDLGQEADTWEAGVNELTAQDSDIAEYVAGLEAHRDEAELPAATGDAIAAEFQRYLRRREHG